jgi:hypothetical protein
MCIPNPFGSDKKQPVATPARAPAPIDTNAQVAQAEPETASSDDTEAKRKGRASLRIDRSVSVSSVGGSGLNVPRA